MKKLTNGLVIGGVSLAVLVPIGTAVAADGMPGNGRGNGSGCGNDQMHMGGNGMGSVDENHDARISALRASFALFALLGVAALFFTGRIPDEPAKGPPPAGT